MELPSCPVCLNEYDTTHVCYTICSQGHTVCGICKDHSLRHQRCPVCRGPEITGGAAVNRDVMRMIEMFQNLRTTVSTNQSSSNTKKSSSQNTENSVKKSSSKEKKKKSSSRSNYHSSSSNNMVNINVAGEIDGYTRSIISSAMSSNSRHGGISNINICNGSSSSSHKGGVTMGSITRTRNGINTNICCVGGIVITNSHSSRNYYSSRKESYDSSSSSSSSSDSSSAYSSDSD